MNAQNTKQHTIVGAKEMIAFRFMLVAWAISLLILCLAGFFFLKAESVRKNELSEMVELNRKCSDRVMSSTPACKEASYIGGQICSKQLKLDCEMIQGFLKDTFEDIQLWNDRSEDSLYIALIVFFLSSLLFYGIRWAITGRLKPLWL